jgi:hypothetical protein
MLKSRRELLVEKERMYNWKAVREVIIDTLRQRKISFRGTMPPGYLQNVWHNRQSNKEVKKILNEILGKSPEDK